MSLPFRDVWAIHVAFRLSQHSQPIPAITTTLQTGMMTELSNMREYCGRLHWVCAVKLT
jgi:hypothetical protein